MKSITSLYLHFPFCKHLCNYCDFYKHKLDSDDQVSDFEKLLKKQFEFHQNYLSQNDFEMNSLETLYIGGGTPSLWGRDGVNFLEQSFKKFGISLDSNCEFTIEVDPDTWTENEIEEWLKLGVNRFSIGSQAYSKEYLKIMDRTHSLEDVEKTIKYFSDRKLNFSVDLMLGLPRSQDRDLKTELEGILKYNPNHLSVYILKTRKNYPLNDELPDDDQIRDEYLFVSEFLSKNGYNHYEVSNFARDGHFSKHNKKYWNYESVAGIGSNATGLLVKDDKSIRYQWKSVSLGIQEEVIEGDSLIIEKLFLGLRFKNNFDMKTLFPHSEKLVEIVNNWKEEKYIESESSVECVNLTALGFLMCDSLIDDIFKQIDF